MLNQTVRLPSLWQGVGHGGSGLMVASSLSGALGDAQVSLSFHEVSLKVRPGFVSWGFAAPVLTSIIVE